MSDRIAQLTLWSLVGMMFLAAWPGAALADLYRYTDASGTVCIVGSLQSVPAKYRNQVQVVKDDSAKAAATKKQVEQAPAMSEEPQPAPTQATAAQPAPANRFEELSAKYVWFKPLAMVCALVFGLLIASRLAQLLPSRQFGRLFYLMVFVGIIVWAYKCYMDQMVGNYLAVKEKVVTMFKKASQREALQPAAKEAELEGTAPAGAPGGAGSAGR